MEDDRWNPVSSRALLKDLSNQNMDPSSTENTRQGCNEKTENSVSFSFLSVCVINDDMTSLGIGAN